MPMDIESAIKALCRKAGHEWKFVPSRPHIAARVLRESNPYAARHETAYELQQDVERVCSICGEYAEDFKKRFVAAGLRWEGGKIIDTNGNEVARYLSRRSW